MTTFASIDEFYADVVARERSREVDFGVMWRDDDRPWPTYRVSWVDATGEFYAIRLGGAGANRGEVELIGKTPPGDDAAAEAALDGWAQQESNLLSWARARLAE